MERFCYECGELFEVDSYGVANHIKTDGGIDYDMDADHVRNGGEVDD